MALTVGLLSIVLLLVVSYAVDLGMQRVARRDMQAVADLVSLDLSRHLDGRTIGQLSLASPSLQVLAERSRERNTGTMGSTPVIGIELGEIGASGAFAVLTAPTATPTAVRVTASTTVAYSFQDGSGRASRSAVAAATSFACYKIGSWAAMVDTGRSALIDPVLRQMAQQSGAFTNGGTVGALSYTGLAQARVDLNDLAAALNLASVEQLASATVSLRSLLVAVRGLARPQATVVVNALSSLAAVAGSAATVQMGKVLAADVGSASLLGATVNALDLVGGSISLLNGTNVANVYLGASLPSLTSAGLTVKLTQGPHQYCGRPGSPATAGVARQTEQLAARVGGQLAPTTLDYLPPTIPQLLSSVASARITAENYATFDLSVAGTSSRLRSVTCGSTQGIGLDVENGLATLTISTPLRAEVRAKLVTVSPLGLPSLVDAVIRINAGVSVTARVGGNSYGDVRVTVPPQELDKPYPTGSGGLTITSVTRSYGNVNANVELLGGLLGASIALSPAQQTQLLDTVLSSGMSALLSPTAPHSLSATVIDPLLALVGARVGGSDVILDSVPALSCSRPKLVA